jgi:hypothetical protein
MKKCCIALAALGLAATSASAASIDVDNLLVGTLSGGGTGLGAQSVHVAPEAVGASYAYQTWTVGQSGRLAQVDLFTLGGSGYSDDGVWYTGGPPFSFDVTLTILGGGTAYGPGDQVLGSITKSANDITQLGVTAFDFSAQNIFATAGTLLTWRMSVEACPTYYCVQSWTNLNNFSLSGGGNTNGYAGGSAFWEDDGVIYDFGHIDLNFRTWMTAVPEPATWGLLIVGFMAVGGALRHRRLALA